MKNLTIAIITSLLLASCNMNPNKEERISQLESEVKELANTVEELETKVQMLETNDSE